MKTIILLFMAWGFLLHSFTLNKKSFFFFTIADKNVMVDVFPKKSYYLFWTQHEMFEIVQKIHNFFNSITVQWTQSKAVFKTKIKKHHILPYLMPYSKSYHKINLAAIRLSKLPIASNLRNFPIQSISKFSKWDESVQFLSWRECSLPFMENTDLDEVMKSVWTIGCCIV
jgi:hypothetical protein